VQFLDQGMLLEDARVVHVPAGAVEEVEVVRNLDEPHATLDQPPRQQAALAELAAVAVPQVGRLAIQVEAASEVRPAQLKALLDRLVVVAELWLLAALVRLAQLGEQVLTASVPRGRDAVRTRQAGRALAGIGQ